MFFHKDNTTTEYSLPRNDEPYQNIPVLNGEYIDEIKIEKNNGFVYSDKLFCL